MDIAIIHREGLSPIKEGLSSVATIVEHPDLRLLSSIHTKGIIIDAEVVPQFELSQKSGDLKQFAYVFYLAEAFENDLRSFCESNHIIPISRTDLTAALKEMKRLLFPRDAKANRLFLFMGADRKAGTTSIVQAVAEELHHLSSRKTLIVSLTRYPNNHLQLKQTSLDELKTRIRTHVIQFSEILSVAEQVEGKYFFLGGSRDILQANQYSVEDIKNFLDVLRNQEEYNVLVDVESDVYNAMTFTALQEISNKFLVMRSLESYYDRFEQCVQQVFSQMKIERNHFKYVLNCFDETAHQVSYLKAHNLISVAKVRYSASGDIAENQRVVLHGLDRSILKDVAPVANLIATTSGTKIEPVDEQKSIFKKLFQRKEIAHV